MSLSQKEYGKLKSLYESVYPSNEELEINEELINEISDELVEEFIEEGYSEEDAIEIVDEAIDFYVDAVLCEVSDSYYDSAVRASKKAAKGLDRAARQKRRAGQVRYAKRKAGEVLKKAGDKVKGAVAGAQIAGSIAKDEARRAGRKAVHSASKAADAVKSAPGKAKDKAKKGIKGLIGRAAKKVASKASAVASRMSEELEALEATGLFSEKEIEAIMEAEVQELYKGKHGQSEKEYQDGRSDAGKMISGDSKHSGAAYSHRSYKGVGKPAKPGERQKNQGKMDRGTRADLEYRKANLKKEEIEVEEGYKEIDAKKHGRMYDRYKKLRSAAMQDARDSGEASGTNRMKMGKMSAAIDKSSENLRKKQTRDQLTGRG